MRLKHHLLKVILIEQLYWHLLANGTSKIYDILFSQDVLSSINVCRALGANITKKDDYLEITGTNGKLHNSSEVPIDLGNSGTTLRLMTSIASLADNEVILTEMNLYRQDLWKF